MELPEIVDDDPFNHYQIPPFNEKFHDVQIVDQDTGWMILIHNNGWASANNEKVMLGDGGDGLGPLYVDLDQTSWA